MLFSSAIFLFLFLPVALGVYYISPKYLKNTILLLFSLVFYTWGEKKFVLVMMSSAVIDYTCGLIIAKGNRKTGLIVSLVTNLSLLAVFKYANFIADNINTSISFLNSEYVPFAGLPQFILPLGISFYTFQTMSYTIDVYRGHVKANKNFIEFATYVTMFPQLVAGPIVRYIDVQNQLRNKDISVSNFSQGTERFIIGLAKKILIANTCATIVDDVFAIPISDISTLWAWIGIIAYSFQIYYDFSGYSDMAIGLGKMFGFDFPENFNYPYIAKSIREFWRRWHISLSTWFRDYLYIPLGGSKVALPRVYLNLFIVFFVTGLWHGASWNFIVWGIYHGMFMIVERLGFGKLLEKTPLVIQHLYTLLVVVVGWVFFRVDTLHQALEYLMHMFSFSPGEVAVSSYLTFFHANSEVVIMAILAMLFAMPIYNKLKVILQHAKHLYPDYKWLVDTSSFCLLFLIFIVVAAFVAAGTYNPFIYFRF